MKKREITIDIKDLMAEMIRKGWLILLVTIICAVAVAGLKYKKDLENLKQQEIIDLSQVELTEEELLEVEEYITTVKERANIQEYIEKSILIKCDPYAVPVMELSYCVTGATENNIDDLLYAYKSYLFTGALADDMAKSTMDYDFRTLNEVVTLRSSVTDNYNFVSIQLAAEDAEQLDELVKVLKQQIENYGMQLSEYYGAHTFSLVSEKQMYLVNEGIIDLRNNKKTQLNTWDEKIASLESNLTSSQKGYVLEELNIQTDLDSEENTLENTGVNTTVTVNMAYVLIGAVVGLVLAVFSILIVYFFSATIKTKKEIQEVYGVPLIGACSLKKRTIDTLVDKIVYGKSDDTVSENCDYLLAKLNNYIENNHLDELYFIGSLDLKEKALLDVIINEVKDCRIAFLGDILIDKDCIGNIKKDAKVILLNTIRKTEHDRVEEEIRNCMEMKADVIGYISFIK